MTTIVITDVGELIELITAGQSTSSVARLNQSFSSIWFLWCYVILEVKYPVWRSYTDLLAC